MALTINNFWGAETGGFEEATSFSGATINSVTTRSGDYSYRFVGSVETATFDPFESVADAGADYIFGVAVNVSSASSRIHLTVNDAGGVATRIQINGTSVILRAAGGGTNLINLGSVLTLNEWHFFEVYFDHSDSGDWEIFLDGVSQGSGATGDTLISGAITSFVAENFTGGASPAYVDDIYFMSGATASSDRLGGCEIYSYRSSVASTTADWIKGSNGDLNSGTWANAQEIVFSESNVALYSDTTARAGGIDTDDVGGSAGTGGPNTDTNITGDIVGMKGIWRMKRSGGSGAVHYGLMGNTGSAIVDGDRTADFDPTTAYANYFDVREDNLPLSTEYGRIGFEKDNKGQDFNCSDMLFQILHVPAVVDGSLVWQPSRLINNFLVR